MFDVVDLRDDEALPFTEILQSVKHDGTKDSNWKRKKSIELDLKKRVDKNLNPALTLPADENGEGSIN